MDRRKSTEEGLTTRPPETRPETRPNLPRSKFEVWGEEMIEKEVRQSGNSGRVYLPPEWVGRHVKIIRID
jgi:putative transposon-encoded protein